MPRVILDEGPMVCGIWLPGEYVFSIFHNTVGDAHTHLKDFGLCGALPNVSDELRPGRVVYSRTLAGRSSIRSCEIALEF